MGDESGEKGGAWVAGARRDQLEWRMFDLDGLLGPEHRARVIWAAVEQMDLRPFYAAIAARGTEPGRPALDPKVLLALWLYATSEGVGSARHRVAAVRAGPRLHVALRRPEAQLPRAQRLSRRSQ